MKVPLAGVSSEREKSTEELSPSALTALRLWSRSARSCFSRSDGDWSTDRFSSLSEGEEDKWMTY